MFSPARVGGGEGAMGGGGMYMFSLTKMGGGEGEGVMSIMKALLGIMKKTEWDYIS